MTNRLVEDAGQESLVDFAFRVYAEPKVEELCLYLQNEYHANINILLWTCWLQARDSKLSVNWLDDVLISVDTLSQLTVGRLQEVRRAIKTSLGFTKVQAKLINKHILNAELTAEKIFLQRMQDMTARFEESQRCNDDGSQRDVYTASQQGFNKDHVLGPQYYLEFLQIPYAEKRASALMAYAQKADVVSFSNR